MLLRIKEGEDAADQSNKMTVVDTFLILAIYGISLSLFVIACVAVCRMF
ncbi:MAG: hypothetical protein JWP78_1587 [Mucilaginibacter sp.]|nr:hypothetical protein [Mucilaginibacter sp.]